MKLIKATEFFTDKSYLLRNFFSSPIYDELCSPFVFGYQEILDGYDNEIIGGDFYMLNYTISGNAKMYFNEREYTLQKGDLTIVHTFSSRRLVKCGDEPWVIHFAHYASFVASSLFKYINQLGEIIIHDFPSELIVPYLSKTYQLLKMSLDEETQHKVSLINYEMLLRIIHYLDSQKKKEKSQDVVDDLIIYMKEHFTDIKSIKKLIETYPYSQTHLERLFRKKMNCTINDYLNLLKLNRSLDLLRTTSLYIKQIADKCGFKDQRSFVYFFQKEMGTTPKAYRKSQQKSK